MGLVINKVQGNSGRATAGFDYYSGLMVYGTAPTVAGMWNSYSSSQFPSVTIKAQQMFSALDATNAGILPNTDNTASTATAVISVKGDTGTTYQITATIPAIGGGTTTVLLGLYTVAVADSTIALQGAAWATIINANTFTTGFTATFTTATLTLIFPKSLGIFPNTGTPFSVATAAPSGSGTPATVAAPTFAVIAGTASQYAIWFYHISEYFRLNPTGTLWVGVISATSSFNEILSLQNAGQNQLRQIGIYDTTAIIGTGLNAKLAAIQTSALVIDGVFPFEAIYSPNFFGVTDLSTLPNGQLLSYNKVSVIISQDGLAQGALLYTVSGQSIGNIGAKLGTLSASRVSASDAQPIATFNLSNGTENNTSAFCNGQLSNTIAATLKTQLSLYRYIFFRTFTGNLAGTYWTDNPTYCVQTNDYAYENDNRVADKITRILQGAYIPYLSQEIIFNNDGTITAVSIESLQNVGIDAIISGMITGQTPPEVSGTPIVTISPTQQVQQTNNLIITVQNGENGIARNITINQGFSN